MNVSACHLSHVFSKESEFTLFSYLNQVRLEKARHLLLDGKHSVKEVAHEVGFNNSHYFSSVFKKKYGCSPSQLRSKRRACRVPKSSRS